MLLPIFLLGAGAPALAAAAPMQDRDNTAAWQAMRQGRLLKIKEVERLVLPTMRGSQYIGFDLEMPSGVYTLKFLRDGTVIWVDVDGHTGQIIGRTGR